jgi:Ribosomal RNA-processing protein 7 (RRP7) C-terminal domain
MAPLKHPDKGSALPMIKGYLPVRLKLPSNDDETFFYVKEHRLTTSKTELDSTGIRRSAGGDTLFVVNAPVVPSAPSKSLLKALFGRYGSVARVTVVENPRGEGATQPCSRLKPSEVSSWTNSFAPPTFLPPLASENQGKFAHVVFDSNSEMKRAYRAFSKVMSSPVSDDEELVPGLRIDTNELQALAPSSDVEEISQARSRKQNRVLAVAQRYQRQYRELAASRSGLLEDCNRVVREFEQLEEGERLAREVSSNKPDEDGFITVGPSAGVASNNQSGKRRLDKDAAERRKSGAKRKRKKSKQLGASELRDFYRFQNKMERKRTLQDLRRSFEDDLSKIQKLKEEKQCVPF